MLPKAIRSPDFFKSGSVHYVADKVLRGSIVTSVNIINLDGTTPKIAVMTDKEYKAIYKEMSKSAKYKNK